MAKLMEGKAGLVTGAASGIGRGSALAFALAGAKVMVADIDEEGGKETVRLIEEVGGIASFFKCNIINEEEVKTLVEATVAAYGKLDFAHNNAGVNAPNAPITESKTSDWDKVIKINLYGVYYALKHEITAMLKTGGGAIVNTASGAGIEGVPNMVSYTASKSGVIALTKSVALEYGNYGIRVNSICPGMTLTPMIKTWIESSPEHANRVRASTPTGTIAKVEDQANAAVFLCSDLAAQINGVALPVDGGYLAGKM